ncbi:MAG: LysM peptidoglycan-binding domain-containing protein [Bacteroidota bacterium]|nr:LysM peptidoglycan-binding domain-containing protein [Bacteroidota bacterium]
MKSSSAKIYFCCTLAILLCFKGINSHAFQDDFLLDLPDTDSLTTTFKISYNYDYVPDASYDLIADRLSCLESSIPLNFNTKVKSFIDYFTVRDREYSKMILRRMEVYFPIFEYYLKKHNMPDELKYLAVVESGLNPKAISRVGATGLWQFMGPTGRQYQLRQDQFIDERMDPYKATEAACLYMKDLYRMFDDWELALAAYNSGPGNVRKAIRKSGYKNGFWAIYDNLLKETRSYVPQFVAVIYTLNYAAEHNLFVEYEKEYALRADTVLLNQSLSLKPLAEHLNICIEDLERLNPEIKRGTLPDHVKNYPLRIPSDKKEYLAENRSSILDSIRHFGQIESELIAKTTPIPSNAPAPGNGKVIYKVKSGDALGKIADKYNVSLSDIKKWNNLSNNIIRPGQNLTVYVKGGNSNSLNNQLANNDKKEPIKIADPKIYRVQPGDTLWDISKKHNNISVDQIKKLNNLKDNNIKVGQKLVVG